MIKFAKLRIHPWPHGADAVSNFSGECGVKSFGSKGAAEQKQ
jgi:hypothetical protein